VLAAGLALAGYFSRPQSYQVAIHRVEKPVEAPEVRTFAPSSELFNTAVESYEPSPAAAPPAAETWRPVVIMTPALEKPARARPPQPSEAATGDGLVRDLQRELRRVGCYLGPIDGVWGTQSKLASAQASAELNHVLAETQPDPALLPLIRKQPSMLCNPCPDGQSLTFDGICISSTAAAATADPALGPGEATELVAPTPPPDRPVQDLFTHPLGTH
jgi:hypothetical protein